MIPEAVLAVEFGVNPEGIAGTAHSHPTFAETFMEAAAAVRRLGHWMDPTAAVASAGRNVGGQGKNNTSSNPVTLLADSLGKRMGGAVLLELP